MFLGHPLQGDTKSCDTTLIKMCDDDASSDAIKKEVIKISKDPLELYETGEMILGNFSSFVCLNLLV